jgi:dinuclear metal center YbgI/SA1388 family protein
MADLRELVAFLDEHLDVRRFDDPALNGLQVEGAGDVERVALGVSVSQRLLDAATGWGAQVVVVHHGLFWGAVKPIAGALAARLGTLLEARCSLVAYHVPLDAHPVDGNNALIARRLGLDGVTRWGAYRGQEIGAIGTLPVPVGLATFVEGVRAEIGPGAYALGDRDVRVRRVAVCSGSGGSLVEQCIADGADVLLTGEPGEPAQELALEGGVAVVAAGHYATERFGVRAIGERLAERFGVEARFFDFPNPV